MSKVDLMPYHEIHGQSMSLLGYRPQHICVNVNATSCLLTMLMASTHTTEMQIIQHFDAKHKGCSCRLCGGRDSVSKHPLPISLDLSHLIQLQTLTLRFDTPIHTWPPHLQKLDIGSISATQVLPPSITDLTWRHADGTIKSSLSIVAHLPLQRLTLCEYLADNDAKWITAFTSLTYLKIAFHPTRGRVQLPPTLTTLHVVNMPHDMVLLPSLQEIHVSPTLPAIVATHSGLTALHFEMNMDTNIESLSRLVNMTQLRHLDIHITSNEFHATLTILSRCTYLHSLELRSYSIHTIHTIQSLSTLTSLTSLAIIPVPMGKVRPFKQRLHLPNLRLFKIGEVHQPLL